MKQKIAIFALAIVTVLTSFAPQLAHAQAPDPTFNPSLLISDSQFSDTKSFSGPDAIQKFLDSKHSVLANTSADFLAMLKEPADKTVKEGLEDPHPNASKVRTAAELIWDAAQSSGLNPQVILVTLNKEQSLITGDFSADRLQRALDFALGFGCPDGGGCGDVYKGFYHQLFGGLDETGSRYLGATKSLMRSFTTPGGRGPLYNGAPAQIGQTIIIANTLGGYDGVEAQQSVTIGNAATAALYRYTPHVFNGNYNFYRFFKEWFGYANGTLLKTKGDKNLYIIQDGDLYIVPPLVAQIRGLIAISAKSVSSKEIKSFNPTKPYGLADDTIIKVNDKFFVFEANVMHPASDFVIAQRKLNAATATVVSESDAKVFKEGPALTPSEGSVLRGQKNAAVYLVENGVLKLFSPLTFAQRNAAKTLQIIPDAELDSFPKDGNVAPLSGTIMKSSSSPTVYLLENGSKYGLTADLFKNRGLSFKDIIVLSDAELAAFPTASLAIPKDNTAIKSRTNPTVYYILGGQVRPMTFKAFQARKVTPASILVFSQAELDSYPKGAILNE
jgi:hypothetical protein